MGQHRAAYRSIHTLTHSKTDDRWNTAASSTQMQVMNMTSTDNNYGDPHPIALLVVKLYENTCSRNGKLSPIFFEITLDNVPTVLCLKQYVLENYSIPMEEQRLEFNGQILADDQLHLTSIGASNYAS